MPSLDATPNRASVTLMPLLAGVSRSFFLSIRQLPAPLRAPVGIGYLLARATDTVADTAELPATTRAAVLEAIAAWAVNGGESEKFRAIASARDFADRQPPGPERDLMLALPACADALAQLPAADQADVREVLRHITRGQLLDVQRFGAASREAPVQLATGDELIEYTYLVAGCVGEFWTRLTDRHLPHTLRLPLDTAMRLARSYGQGLQLVNILRDADADAAQGRRYLPTSDPEPFYWKVRAALGMDDGLRYALALDHRRLRVASALPALLGIRTIRLMRDAAPGTTVRMPRAEVRDLMLRTALSLGGRGTLRTAYGRLGDGWDNRPR